MNLALFITHKNIAEVEAFCVESAKLQNDLVNGCLAVIHQKQIDPKRVAAVVSALSPKFKVKVAIPVVANLNHGELSQVSLLVSRFLIAAYSRYPGSWLMMDQLAMPTVPNWMQVVSKQHNANQAQASGRGVKNKGSLIPVGPFVMELPFKSLRFLTAVTSEGWRSRGQYFFARCGFCQIGDDEWLFRMGSIAAEKAAVESTQILESASDNLAGPAVTHDQHVNPQSPWKNLPSQHSVIEDSKALTKAELLDEAERLTGTRPHHFTSEAKLRALIDQTTAQA